MERLNRAAILAAWLIMSGWALAADPPGAQTDADLHAIVEQQGRRIQELQKRVAAFQAPQPSADPPAATGQALDDAAVKKIVADYLRDNPGAGMPPGVQSGYELGRGFVIRSASSPTYVKWEDDCRIPFELRCRVRLQLAYYRYKVTDTTNYLNSTHAVQNANSDRLADFSQLELKRGQVILEGCAFDPDLRYHFRLHGDTRGLPGIQNNRVVENSGFPDPNTSGSSPIGGGVTVDHSVRLFEAWVAYDFHGCASEKGCNPDCPPDATLYRPTYTLIAGKMKPFFGLEEFMGNATEQFVEFPMASLFFSADDDNRLMAAGWQVKTAEDRFFAQALLTNGSESLFANTQMDDFPGFVMGAWYDLGGHWNAERKAWDLFGDSISDIDYSCLPVARLGGSMNIVPMDRRSLYGDAEQSRFFVAPGGPGGTRLINLLDGDSGIPAGANAVDRFDAYEFNLFAAAKYRGFSVLNEWWLRDLNDFHTAAAGRGNIVYQDTLGPGGAMANALFPVNTLVDYGMNLQAGYFLVPRKFEVAVRWSWVRGESGDINGNHTFHTVALPGFAKPVQVVDGAFRHFHEADEYTIGFNYYFHRQLWKWQTDIGFYEGGNPAGGGQSIAGFIAGSDGYLIRTQIQLFF